MLGLIISLDVLTDGIAQGLELLLIDVVCAAAPPIKDLNWVRTRLSVDLRVVPCRGPQYPPKTVGVIKNGSLNRLSPTNSLLSLQATVPASNSG